MAQNPSNVIPDQLIVVEGGKQLVPPPSSSDSGKVLGVLNSNGDIGWTEDREGMAQQQADWAEDDPSKVTYIANKPSGQMAPASTTSDSGKVLKVDAQGAPVWGDVSGVAEFLWSTVTRAEVDAAIADGKMPVILDDTFSGEKTYCYLYNTQSASPADTLHFASFPVPGTWSVLYHMQSAYIWVLSFNPGGVKSRESKHVAAEITSDNSITLLDDSGKLKITVANPLPASTSSDEGSVLTVNSSGNAAWATPSTVTVDQTYDASSTNAQSGTAVASAISGINQVPASTSADEDKVLTVNSSGTPEWATAQGGGGVTPPTPTTEDYGFTYASIQGFRQGVPTVRTEWAPASFTLFSPFWDSSAGTSRYYTEWWTEFPNHLRGLLGDVGSYAPFWGNMYNQAWSDSGASPWPSVGNRFSADVTLKFPLSVDTSVFTTVLNIDCNITARGADPMGMGDGPEIVLYNAYPRLKLARGESGYQYFFHQMHIPMCVNNRPISEIGNIIYEISVPQGTTMSVPAASQYSQEDLNDFGIYVTFHPETSFQTVYS